MSRKVVGKGNQYLKILMIVIPLILMGCPGEKPADPNADLNAKNLQTLGCLPLSTNPVPFVGTDIWVDQYNIIGGKIPFYQTIGTMSIVASAGGGSYQSSSADGAISMQVTQNQGGGWGGWGYSKGSVSGWVQVSQQVIDEVKYELSFDPYFQQNQQLCVHKVALNLGLNGTAPFGEVYLYLDANQTKGFWVRF